MKNICFWIQSFIITKMLIVRKLIQKFNTISTETNINFLTNLQKKVKLAKKLCNRIIKKALSYAILKKIHSGKDKYFVLSFYRIKHLSSVALIILVILYDT